MWNGILNVCKEPGCTSNDVIVKLRSVLHQKKIGHAGTLDPDASGVLVVLLGSGCRISDYLMNHDKAYSTSLLLGTITDTQDLSGTVLEERETNNLSPENVRDAVMSFEGEYDQTPPMYSAKKVGGRKLYDLARQGVTVDRKSVRVGIKRIGITRISLPEVAFTVECSKGTYIRTLCADIGDKLGCGAVMTSLVRTRSGGFHIEDALTVPQIKQLADEHRLEEKIIPVEEMFLDLFRAHTKQEADKKLLNGGKLACSELGIPERGAGHMIRVCTSTGAFIAVYRQDTEHGGYVPWKMLPGEVWSRDK